MIRKLIALTAAVAALGLAPAASAAEKEGVRVGLGIGIAPFNVNSVQGVLNAPPVSIYVPIDISPQLRVEPSLGFTTFSGDQNVISPSSGYAWDLAVGGFYLFPHSGGFGMYAGGRLGLSFQGLTENGGNTETTETDFFIKAALGAEYHFAPRFSLGAEAQLGLTFFGDQHAKVGGVTTTPNRGLSGIATNGLLFARYYF